MKIALPWQIAVALLPRGQKSGERFRSFRRHVIVSCTIMLAACSAGDISAPSPSPDHRVDRDAPRHQVSMALTSTGEIRQIDFVRTHDVRGRVIEKRRNPRANAMGRHLQGDVALSAASRELIAKRLGALPSALYAFEPTSSSDSRPLRAFVPTALVRQADWENKIEVPFPVDWESPEPFGALYTPEQTGLIVDAALDHVEGTFAAATSGIDQLIATTGEIDMSLFPDPGPEPSDMAGTIAAVAMTPLSAIRLSRSLMSLFREGLACDDLLDAMNDATIDFSYAVVAFGVGAATGAVTGGASLAVGIAGVAIFDWRLRRAIHRFASCKKDHPEDYRPVGPIMESRTKIGGE